MSNFLIGLFFYILCLFTFNKKSNQNKKTACFIVCIIMIIQAGFRDFDMGEGNDTMNYYMWYNGLKITSWSQIFSSLNFVAESYNERDPGFVLFVKATQLIYSDYRFFLILVASIISIPLCILFYRLIPSVHGIFFAGIVFESLFASFFMSATRQTVAMGIIYSSIPLLLHKKYIMHYLAIFIAYFIHSTAIIFLPIGVLLLIKNQSKLLLYSIIAFPVLMVTATLLLTYIGTGTIFENYVTDSEHNLGTPVFTFFVCIITLMVLYFSKQMELFYPKVYRFVISSIALSCVLVPTSWVESNFIRIVFYHLIFICIALPMIFDVVPKKIRNLNSKSLYITTGLLLLVLMYK